MRSESWRLPCSQCWSCSKPLWVVRVKCLRTVCVAKRHRCTLLRCWILHSIGFDFQSFQAWLLWNEIAIHGPGVFVPRRVLPLLCRGPRRIRFLPPSQTKEMTCPSRGGAVQHRCRGDWQHLCVPWRWWCLRAWRQIYTIILPVSYTNVHQLFISCYDSWYHHTVLCMASIFATIFEALWASRQPKVWPSSVFSNQAPDQCCHSKASRGPALHKSRQPIWADLLCSHVSSDRRI